MKIYTDRISGDEMLSDGFDIQEVDGVVYEVATKIVQKSAGGEIAGVDDEEADVDDAVESVNNLVDAHRLQQTSFDKKSFTIWIKGYMKAVKEHLEKENPDRVKPFMKAASLLVKKILGNFAEYEFFTGESMSAEGAVALCFYKEDGVTPYFWFFKDGLDEEKV